MTITIVNPPVELVTIVQPPAQLNTTLAQVVTLTTVLAALVFTTSITTPDPLETTILTQTLQTTLTAGQGPAGPQGIQGIQGPIGPQGPAGTTFDYSTHALSGFSTVILDANHAGDYPVIGVRVFNPIGNEVEIVYAQTATEVTITSNVDLTGHTAYIF